MKQAIQKSFSTVPAPRRPRRQSLAEMAQAIRAGRPGLTHQEALAAARVRWEAQHQRGRVTF